MEKIKLNIQLFATSASVKTATVDGRYLRLTVAEQTLTDEDKLANRSRVKWTFESCGGNSTYYTIYNWSVKVAGNQIYAKQTTGWSSYEFPAKKGTKTGTINITHNPDGTASNVSFTLTGKVQSSGDATFNGSINLTTIPRASAITSVTNGTTDYYPVLTWTPASNTFTYKVQYSFGNWSYTSNLISPASTAEQTFSSYQITGANVAQYMTRATETFTATLYTYQSDGTTQIGDAQTKTFTVTLADSYKPTVTYGSVTDVGGIVPSNWGVLVQGKSKLSFAITATASTGSTIAAYDTVIEGNHYATANVTTSFLQNTGTYSFTPTATDSRGRTGSATAHSYTVYSYSAPAITTVFADRCLQNGTLDPTGTYLKYSFAGTISSCNNKNAATCRLGYKLKTATNYTYTTISNNSSNVVLSGVTFSASFPYDIIFEITDSFGAVATEHLDLRTGFKLVHYNANKQAIAIGKTSEATATQKLLEVALPTNITANTNITGTVGINGATSITGNMSATGNITASGNLSGGLANTLKTNILNYMYPVGTTYVTKTNVNPGTFLGGNWQIYDKKLKSQIIIVNNDTSGPYFTKNTTNCNSSDFRFDIADHWITVDFRVGNKVALNDTAYTMGTFNLSSFTKCFSPYDASTNPTGSNYAHAHYTTAHTDGGNSLVMMQVTNAGIMQTLDAKPNNVAAGNTVQGCFIIGSYWGDLVDSACDQFYWERQS